MTQASWHPLAWHPRAWHPAAWVRQLAPEEGAARYRIYRAARRSGPWTLVAEVAAGWTQFSVAATPGSDLWYRVVAVARAVGSAEGTPDGGTAQMVHVRVDAGGALLPPLPNAPQRLRLTQDAGRRVSATWIYHETGQEEAPATFCVYTAIGTAAFDFGQAAATIAYAAGREFFADLGSFEAGTRLRAVVAAVTAAGQRAIDRRESSIVVAAARPDPLTAVEVHL